MTQDERDRSRRGRARPDPSLVAAYRETAYHVYDTPPFVLRVGKKSRALVLAQQARGAVSSAFITACNPDGRLHTEQDNRRFQAQFERMLLREGFRFVHAMGGGPDQVWPPERSVLIFGLSLRESTLLGRNFRQRAILWSGAQGIPQLIWIP